MPRVKIPSGNLYVGLSTDGRHVIVNHPDLQPDAEGCGHIVFSHREAVNFATLILRKVSIAQGIICGHCGELLTQETGWATALFCYCFKAECQQEFYKEAQAMIRAVDPELADRMAEARKPNTFTCPKCGKVSHNPNDVKERYCGACHEFFNEQKKCPQCGVLEGQLHLLKCRCHADSEGR